MALINQWSLSRLTMWEACARKAKYKVIDKLPEPFSGPAADRGIAVHAGLEGYLKGDSPQMPKEVKPTLAMFYAQLRDRQPLVEHRVGFTRKWEETEFFSKTVWGRMVFDTIGYDEPSFTVEINDHKTGKVYPEKHKNQLQLYSASAFILFPDAKCAVARNIYTDIGPSATLDYKMERGSDDAKITIQKIEARVAKMEADTVFSANPGPGCKWCHYRKSNDGPCSFG